MKDQHRVKKRRDFTIAYRKGHSLPGRNIVLCWRKTGERPYRVGFTVSKKVGNAVTRNVVRRRLREITRLRPELFADGRDYIIIARPAAAFSTYRELERELEKLTQKI